MNDEYEGYLIKWKGIMDGKDVCSFCIRIIGSLQIKTG